MFTKVLAVVRRSRKVHKKVLAAVKSSRKVYKGIGGSQEV
jgi:hypothetical protein